MINIVQLLEEQGSANQVDIWEKKSFREIKKGPSLMA